MDTFNQITNLVLLGNNDLPKVPIFSFIIKTKEGKVLNPQIVTSIFNDLFGIQTRSGCACAGLLGHALLSLSDEVSQ